VLELRSRIVNTQRVTPKEAVSLIRRQIAQAPTRQPQSEMFTRWNRDTRQILSRAFGSEALQVQEFSGVNYEFHGLTYEGCFQEAFQRGLRRAVALLESMAAEVEEFGLAPAFGDREPPVNRVVTLCNRFHRVAQQLRSRHGGRKTLDVNDEYDVQDLLNALLRIDFQDVRPEECTPSYAGGASRMDFLLKTEQLVIEVKKTRPGLLPGKIGEELIVDIARYKTHPDCKHLLCFVYDPEARISNPAELERDLSGERVGIQVTVLVRPSG
jgi:hypothetical protein